MIEWGPSTCICILEYEIIAGVVTYRNWIQKCQEHKNQNNQTLIDSCQTLNKSFTTDLQRRNEQVRIRNMGKPITKNNGN